MARKDDDDDSWLLLLLLLLGFWAFKGSKTPALLPSPSPSPSVPSTATPAASVPTPVVTAPVVTVPAVDTTPAEPVQDTAPTPPPAPAPKSAGFRLHALPPDVGWTEIDPGPPGTWANEGGGTITWTLYEATDPAQWDLSAVSQDGLALCELLLHKLNSYDRSPWDPVSNPWICDIAALKADHGPLGDSIGWPPMLIG